MSILKWIRQIIGDDDSSSTETEHDSLQTQEIFHKWIIINEGGFQIVSEDEVEIKKYWNDIEDVELRADHVILKVKGHPDINIPNTYFEWYNFIQQVPPGFQSFDYQGVQDIMAQLTPCFVCGLISVNHTRCFNCGFDSWEPMNYNLPPREEYYREAQLHYFEPFEGEPLNLSNAAKSGFKTDPKWTCLVSPEDFGN